MNFFSFTPGSSYPLPQVYIACAKRIVQDHARFQGIHSSVLIQDRGIRSHIYNPCKDCGKIGATDNFDELAFDDQRASLNNRGIDKSALDSRCSGSLKFVGDVSAGYFVCMKISLICRSAPSLALSRPITFASKPCSLSNILMAFFCHLTMSCGRIDTGFMFCENSNLRRFNCCTSRNTGFDDMFIKIDWQFIYINGHSVFSCNL